MEYSKRLPWKRILLLIWLLLGAVALYSLATSGIPARKAPAALRVFMLSLGHWGPVVFVILYSLRTLILFPVGILTLAAGLAWGPLAGALWTILAENLSAGFGFLLGRYFGHDWAESAHLKIIERLDRQLCRHGFVSVLVLRLLYAPFDPVNFACGMTNMSYREYAAGTFLGVIPSIISLIYFGHAWTDRRSLLIAAILFIASLVAAYFVSQHRHAKAALDAHNQEP